MTAIGGIIGFRGYKPDRADILRLQSVLEKFGRDAQNFIHQNNLGLVRTLLRSTSEDFLDSQPLIDRKTKTSLVFDGRIDNREEIARKLQISSLELERMADSDVVFCAILRWGRDACLHLLGDFALAVWCPDEELLWLARDPLGIRPLFWCMNGDVLIFASHAPSILSLGGVGNELDLETLHDTIALIPNKSERSFFKRINRVIPGHVVSVSADGTTQARCYHDFVPRKRIHYHKHEDYVEALAEVLQHSVSCRLRTNGPIASHLSSGLDSTSVTVVAASLLHQFAQSLFAVTAAPRQGYDGNAPRGRHADESINASLVAQEYPNIRHSIHRHQQSTYFDHLDQIISTLGRPPLNLDNIGWADDLKRYISSSGAKVVLTGWFGNFTISYSGAERLSAEFRRGQWLALSRELLAYRRRFPKSYKKWAIGMVLGPSMPKELWLWWSRRYGECWGDVTEYTGLNPSCIRSFDTYRRAKEVGYDLAMRGGKFSIPLRIHGLGLVDPGEYALLDDIKGIVSRHPLGDIRLIQYALSIPDQQFLFETQHSWLARRFLSERVPEEFFESTTRGQQSADWHEIFERSKGHIAQALARAGQNRHLSSLLDLASLNDSLEQYSDDFYSFQTVRDIRLRLLRSVSIIEFVLRNS